MRRAVTPAALLLATVALAGCGGGSGGAQGGGGPAANDADVAFAQGMIPHHRQAVEMAGLAEEQARDAEVKRLAADIEAAQAPEIEQLSAWLEEWGEDVPSATDHGGHDRDMPGMMSEEDMADLEEASGEQFDRMWLEMMVDHHEGAVEMARTEVAEGEHPDAVALAEQVIDTQEAEIEQMEELLGS